jgi:hypothetical protein
VVVVVLVVVVCLTCPGAAAELPGAVVRVRPGVVCFVLCPGAVVVPTGWDAGAPVVVPAAVGFAGFVIGTVPVPVDPPPLFAPGPR